MEASLHHLDGNQQLADNLNEFNCRLDRGCLTPHTHSNLYSTQPSTPLAIPPLSAHTQPELIICVKYVLAIQETDDHGKHQAQTMSHPPVLKSVQTMLLSISTQIFDKRRLTSHRRNVVPV